ncbi:Cys-Gln thioester bond-forming surface protein [Streptomyces sp. NPDC005840]|uniref:Cys-Gln thioester bond-forming surface protein n=1 Tax=Streptomyces doudnae TaxID=3075536 RepID=A0ABD5F291_9ACTN|nr:MULTISPECIES: Cys-Gln thioester bond-forming surface protein [unclassified Streptomyces]MDT0439974.1 Cys-Gln thioester bond-forming surface protein [Streptomyces sp. DSM 41981]MYQ62303.1 Cys-Gln thioester bond-forming surface protein [Streptomyces sp. SID4950]SCD34729.1 LPXTG-motif cell wall anchor domain-containing protein/TQXA domain-containing protein [Streptomyces sp. SolWspMP-5a-2]
MLSVFSVSSLRRRATARLAALTLASGLLTAGALAGAGAAAAEGTAPGRSGATATIGGLKTYGTAVIHDETGDQQVSAGLFEMSVDGGGTLQTYCIDLHNPTQRDARYHETSWSGTSLASNKQAGKIRWILQNSYPQVNDLAALAAKAGVKGGLTEQDAAAGTQVAIWRYSDAADIDAVEPRAEKLADYLEKNAVALTEPTASLTLDPPAVSGHPGERLGPVTVRTDAGGVSLTPPADAVTSGVRIVGEDGEEITDAADGDKVFFDVPEDAADGSAALTVQASTTVPVGRALVSESRSQTQILAGSSESTVSATATATWGGQGAVPALSSELNCVKGGLDITAANRGDEEFAFSLMGTDYAIPAGESRTVTVPLREDQAYDFTISGPGALATRFTGVLDCRTQSSEEGGAAVQTLSEPSPATVGGISGGDTNLAATGSTSPTPLIAGVAIGFVVIGGAALVVIRKREEAAGES